ncbi:sugar phosphate isomerase/epimerase family protein [Gracilibacillus alcaliphilus]|uniref:sugar phosphate isomerase/epimerase family protein n=1 Tax=Gracilibacillus alcaliphilus TaxID=1401441 RepID=UPI00195E40C1|nr:sugar phosphate isomerase/epimerase family protein [Gracilibacillus alcaliphilus]MBM7675459.1 sugar phosphate isomerase/epimerase [Gracilibacillus alcaliphilus]
MKFSVFTVMAPDTTPEEMILYLKETGYDGVEWRFKETPEEVKQQATSFWGNNLCTIDPSITDAEIERLAKLGSDNGIDVFSVTPYLTSGDLQATERVLEVAQKFGASSIRVGVPRYDRSKNYLDLYKEAVSYLQEVEQMCKQYKVKGLVETHHETITPSAALAYRLVQSCNPDHIGVLYDPGNMVHEGYENYRMGMELLGDYLAHVHVKNAKWKQHDGNWQVEWALLDEGVVNWAQVLADLKAVGYDGNIGMEDFSGAYGTKDSLKYNIDMIKEYLNRV